MSWLIKACGRIYTFLLKDIQVYFYLSLENIFWATIWIWVCLFFQGIHSKLITEAMFWGSTQAELITSPYFNLWFSEPLQSASPYLQQLPSPCLSKLACLSSYQFSLGLEEINKWLFFFFWFWKYFSSSWKSKPGISFLPGSAGCIRDQGRWQLGKILQKRTEGLWERA